MCIRAFERHLDRVVNIQAGKPLGRDRVRCRIEILGSGQIHYVGSGDIAGVVGEYGIDVGCVNPRDDRTQDVGWLADLCRIRIWIGRSEGDLGRRKRDPDVVETQETTATGCASANPDILGAVGVLCVRPGRPLQCRRCVRKGGNRVAPGACRIGCHMDIHHDVLIPEPAGRIKGNHTNTITQCRGKQMGNGCVH